MRVLLWGFLGAFAIIAVNLVWLRFDPDMQLNKPDAGPANERQVSRVTAEDRRHVGTVELRIPRGDIRDRHGSLLATDRQVESVWADPRLIDDPLTASLYVSAQLGVDEDLIYARLDRRDAEGNRRKFVWIKRWLGDEELVCFEGLQTRMGSGLALKNEPIRFYPEGDLAAHVLGFANREGVGCEGVERAFDVYLRGVPGRQRCRVDNRRNILDSLTLEYVEPEGGYTVFLTIDKAIQYTLERELDKALERTAAPRAMGIVMDPNSGAVYALACRPAFDPNHYSDFPAELYTNRALVDVFEPGSSFKIVTASGAIEHGLVTLATPIDCEGGSFNPYGHRIHDYHSLNTEPFATCYAQSSNIATIKVAAMLGPERLDNWIHRFGFGQRTCEDFAVESRGLVWPRRVWTRYSMGAIPIGQEISVTLPQLARAFSIIANGGFFVKPYVVERVVDREDRIVYQHQAPPRERVLSAGTATVMKELSHLVVLEGTGRPAGIPEYRVGGKTGTAQVARPGGKGYYKDKYTAVFAGFAPMAAPRVCAAIVAQEPGIRQHWGGYCCGPVFKAVVRDALIRLACPVDPVTVAVDAAESFPVRSGVGNAAEDPGLRVADGDELTGGESEPLDSLELVTTHPAAEGQPVLPCLKGLTMRQAKSRLATLGLGWDFQGHGRVILQDPAEYTPLSEISLCRLVFAAKPRYDVDDTKPTGPDSRG